MISAYNHIIERMGEELPSIYAFMVLTTLFA